MFLSGVGKHSAEIKGRWRGNLSLLIHMADGWAGYQSLEFFILKSSAFILHKIYVITVDCKQWQQSWYWRTIRRNSIFYKGRNLIKDVEYVWHLCCNNSMLRKTHHNNQTPDEYNNVDLPMLTWKQRGNKRDQVLTLFSKESKNDHFNHPVPSSTALLWSKYWRPLPAHLFIPCNKHAFQKDIQPGSPVWLHNSAIISHTLSSTLHQVSLKLSKVKMHKDWTYSAP